LKDIKEKLLRLRKGGFMWYFTWFIGVTMAVLLAVMHALWLEVQEDDALLREKTRTDGGTRAR
jgi:cyd operon protein YbgT